MPLHRLLAPFTTHLKHPQHLHIHLATHSLHQPTVCRISLTACKQQLAYTMTTISSAPATNGSTMQKAIGTHSGTFHADEALACFMLRHLPQYKDYPVVRSRDPAVHSTLPILVDVGGIYDVEQQRFDHHQRGFDVTFDAQHTVKLSSAGLVYKHYGKQVIDAIITKHNSAPSSKHHHSVSPAEIDLIYHKIYDQFIQAMDGIDNGVLQYPLDVKPQYTVNTDLSSRIGQLNPQWNEESTDEILLEKFYQAIEVTGADFVTQVLSLANTWLPARTVVKSAFDVRQQFEPSGQLLVLDQPTVWKSHIFDLEEETNAVGQIKYVLYPDDRKQWRIQAMPADRLSSFANRLPLPEPWRGLRDAELSKACGVEGGVFVHAGGFIGGNQTREGALEMAKKAIAKAPADGADQNKKIRTT